MSRVKFLTLYKHNFTFNRQSSCKLRRADNRKGSREIIMNIQTILNIISTSLSGRNIDMLKEVDKFLMEMRKENLREIADQFEKRLIEVLEKHPDKISQFSEMVSTIVADTSAQDKNIDYDSKLNSGNYAEYWNHLARILPPDEATGQGQPDMHIKQYDYLTKECMLRKDDVFLDIGTGSLRGTRLIIPYLNRKCFYGMDVSQNLLEFARKRVAENSSMAEKQPSFACDDRFRFAMIFPGIEFNFAFAKSILTHLYPESVWDCLVQLKRVIKQDGVFYATIFKDNSVKIYRGDTRQIWYNTKWLAETSELSGWRLTEIGETQVGQYMCRFNPV